MRELIVVGGGVAGALVATAARERGIEALVIDDGRPEGGSRASEGLFAAGWTQKFGPEVFARAMGLLSRNFEVRTVDFNIGRRLSPMQAVDPEALCWPSPLRRVVRRIEDGYVETLEGERLEARQVVACLGSWAVPMRTMVGHTLRFAQPWTEAPYYKLFAPYRQAKVVPIDRETTLFGDTTLLLPASYDRRRAALHAESLERARGFGLDPAKLIEVRVGRRPFVDHATQPIVGRHGTLAQLGNRLHVLNGGGRIGTLVYAFGAERLAEKLWGKR